MKWVIRGYSLILLAYCGWRTFDFMRYQLPTGDFSMVLALFFLFATEAGLILWHEISLRHTGTHEQHNVATGLTILDFVGSLGAGIADMILRQSFMTGYAIPPVLGYFLLYGLPLLVAANVAGVIYYERNDSETQLDQAKKALKFEIQRQALRELKDNQGAIAEGMKRDIFKSLKDDVTGKIAKQYLELPKAQEKPAKRAVFMLPNLSRNGHTYNVDTEEAETVDRPNVDIKKVKK